MRKPVAPVVMTDAQLRHGHDTVNVNIRRLASGRPALRRGQHVEKLALTNSC